MADGLAGSAGDSESIVCYCFCRLPLVPLRAKDLMDHRMDNPDELLMTHFHLPFEATQRINRDNWLDWNAWLCRLHKAYRSYTDEAEIRTFERNMEEEFKQVEETLRSARERVRAIRETYDAEVARAIEETKSKSIEQWDPKPDSLASLILNFSGTNSPHFKVFNLNFECSALRLSIESRLPALAHCDLHIGPEQSELEALRRENARLCQELEAAKGAVGSPIVQKTEPIAVQVAERSSDQDTSEVFREVLGARNCPIEFDEDPRMCQGSENIKPLYTQPKNAMPVLVTAPRCVKRIMEEEPHAPKEEIDLPEFEKNAQLKCMKLEAEGPSASGLGWTEHLGVHLGKFEKAEEIVNEAIGGQRELAQASEVELKAMYVKAALHFHRGQVKKCLKACSAVVEHCGPNRSDLFWTTVYFYAVIASSDAAEEENRVRKWLSVSPEPASLSTTALKLCAEGKLAFNQKKYESARLQLLEAQNFVTNWPFLSAMNNFFLARIYYEQKDYEKAREFHETADHIFSFGFSNSIWHGVNLNWLGEAFRDLESNGEAISAKKRADEIFERYFPSKLYYTDNLTELAELNEGKRLEIYYREKARTAFSRDHPTDIKAMQNLTQLGRIYSKRDSSFEKAKSYLHDAEKVLTTKYQNSIENGQNFCYLAQLYEKCEQVTEAILYANKAKELLMNLDPKEAKEELEKVEKVLDNLVLSKRRKRE